MTTYEKEYLHELINSGITLNDKETLIAEDYLLDNSECFYPVDYPVPPSVIANKRSKTLRSGAVYKARRRTKK